MPEVTTAALLIPLLPLFSFLILIFWASSAPRAFAAFSTIMLAIATGCAAYLFFASPDPTTFERVWFSVSGMNMKFDFAVGLTVDGLSTTMAFIVTFVSLMIHIYSFGYMKGHADFGRFYAFLALFTCAMLTLVLASNFLLMFAAWEGVGLCSYFLIGFYFDRPSAANAGVKAFVTTRIGDLGFIAAILVLLYYGARSLGAMTDLDTVANLHAAGIDPANGAAVLNFTNLKHLLSLDGFSSSFGMWLVPLGLLLFCGAVGKSAQFPLHVWLPDAMEGPTPVSALIHAATMVVAGVYLVARTFFIFYGTPAAETLGLVITIVGVFTAFMAATIAVRTYDLKRVLAYSTISQIGFMIAALGLGSMLASMFHVATHAFFKSLLFLAAGSIYHSYTTLDIRNIRGVAKSMKITATTFLIGSLALAGLPFVTAGFFSKEAILAAAYVKYPWAFWILAITAGLTAFYMFRLIFSIYGGSPNKEHHPHESPSNMTIPLCVLSVFSIGAGYFGHYFSTKLGGELPHGDTIVLIVSILFALGGIFLAWAIYSAKFVESETLHRAMYPISMFLNRKWYWDEIYDHTVLALTRMTTRVVGAFDDRIVDDLYTLSARLSVRVGESFRHLHSGLVQVYMLVMAVALLILIFIFNLIRFS